MTRRRLRQHGNPFNIRGPIAAPDWHELFGREAPLAIDIGFGAGRFLIALAQDRPMWNVLGLEIRDHWVEQVLAEAETLGLTNLHALIANANSHLADLVPDRSVVFVSLNFPDPWFKKRHQKRRVLRQDWLDLLTPKLLPGAELHYMTDYQPGAQEALELLRAHPGFASPEPGFAAESTTGLRSERELTHQRRNQPVYRLRYTFDPNRC